MTAPQRPDRQQISEDHAFALLLQQGEGYERCYNAFAPALYRYCWTLLGTGNGQEDAAAEAVREAFLAAVELLPHLSDPDLFRAWLFALARAACERRGFASESPYTLLNVHHKEQPFVNALSSLPPSQRELLELSLRHGLTHTQIAAVLGLSAETVSDLCRSAAQQAADLLTEQQPDAHGPGSRWFTVDIPLVVNSIALPGPPRHLRAQVVTECSEAASAAQREHAANLLRPLGSNGFPLSRARETEPVADESTVSVPHAPAEHAASAMPGSAMDATANATTTASTGNAAAGEPQRLSGWLVPATAGLITALAAFSLWGLGVFTNQSESRTAAQAPPPVTGVSVAPMSEHVPASPTPETGKAPSVEITEPSLASPPAEPVESATPDGGEDAAEPVTPIEEPDAPPPVDGESAPANPPAPAPQEPNPTPREEVVSEPQPAPAAPPAPEPEPAQPAQEEQPRRTGGGVIALLEGVLGLLGLHGNR